MSGIIGSKLNIRGSGLVGSLGTDGQHMLSAGAGKTNVFETVAAAESYDDEPIKSDLTALAIREATNESSAAFNLPGSFIETFTDDTNLGTQTDVDRISGYVASVTYGFGSQALVDRTTGTAIGDMDEFGGLAAAFDDTTDQVHSSCAAAASNSVNNTNPSYIGKDWGSGNVKYITGFKYWSSNNDGTHESGGNDNTDNAFYLLGHTADVPASATLLGTFDGRNFRTSGAIEHSKLDFTRGTGYRYHWVKVLPGSAILSRSFCAELKFYEDPFVASVSATGTLIQAANTVTGTRTEVGGTMLYSDEEGTATLGTDLKIYFSCDNSNWTETDTYTAITPVYASGIKQVRLGKMTCTGGTDVRYKAVFANQASGSKETQLHGIGINY